MFDEKLKNDTKTKRKNNAPWNPYSIAVWMFVITTIGAGIGLAWNWRRLGRPNWMWGTIALTFLIPVGIIGFVVFAVSRMTPGVPMTVLQNAVLMGVAGCSFAFIWFTAVLQQSAYRVWETTGDLEQMRQQPLNYTKAGLVAGGVVLSFAVVGAFFAIDNQRTTTVDLQGYSVEYGKSWRGLDPQEVGFCTGGYYECDLVLSDNRFGYTTAAFISYDAESGMSLETYAEQSWENISYGEGVVLEVSETRQINGQTAYVYEYFADSTDGEAVLYVMSMYLSDGGRLVEVTVWSYNVGIFNENRTMINRLLDGIRFE